MPSTGRWSVPDRVVGQGLSEAAEVAGQVAAAWGLTLGRPFPLARFSYVAPAGADAVLKVRLPGDDESEHEAEALDLWAGDGAVRLLRSDPARRAVLLERVSPGADLSALPDPTATAIAVAVGLRLWRPAAEPFRWIGDHVPRWLDEARRSWPDRRALVSLACELYAALDPGRGVLVHGDFHHHNLLRSGDRHVAIDPKPMLGEPEYDVAPFLWNPLGSSMTLGATERRLAAFAAAGLDEERMRAWAVIRGAYLGVGDNACRVLLSLV